MTKVQAVGKALRKAFAANKDNAKTAFAGLIVLPVAILIVSSVVNNVFSDEGAVKFMACFFGAILIPAAVIIGCIALFAKEFIKQHQSLTK